MSFLDDLRAFLQATKDACNRHGVEDPFTGLVKSSWDILLQHGWKLRDSFPDVTSLNSELGRVLFSLKQALLECIKFVDSHVHFLSSAVEEEAPVPVNLRLGLGSPSTTGCLDAHGVSVKMQVLCNHPSSVQAAFMNTGLHAIGLTGARLPLGFRLPVSCGFKLISCGQANYNSVAVVVRSDFEHCFSRVEGLGSDRRLWLKVHPSDGSCFFWLVFYLPANNETDWHQEVSGIDSDVATLRHAEFLHIPQVLWMGDANLQPSALGKGPDSRPSRDKRWAELVDKWFMSLWNPSAFGGVPCPLFLPRHKKTVFILPSDTHHCNGGPGVSRTLDLVYGSPGLQGHACIHNGLHCKPAGCGWDDCFEFTGSDHFLVEAILDNVCICFEKPAIARLPSQWHEQALWEHGLNRSSEVLHGLLDLVVDFQRLIHQKAVFRKASLPHWVVWAVEVCTLVFCILESCVRDGWVLFADTRGRKRFLSLLFLLWRNLWMWTRLRTCCEVS